MTLATFLDVAIASIQTTMMEIDAGKDESVRMIEAYCELELAIARVRAARRLVR